MEDHTKMNQVEAIDCELAVYRKGCITVHINLIQGYLTLRESRQWCNNFTRTISAEQIETIRKWLAQSDLAHQIVSVRDIDQEDGTICQECTGGQPALVPEAANRVVWLITMTVDGKKKTRTGALPFPDGWRDMQRLIERLSRVPFRLI